MTALVLFFFNSKCKFFIRTSLLIFSGSLWWNKNLFCWFFSILSFVSSRTIKIKSRKEYFLLVLFFVVNWKKSSLELWNFRSWIDTTENHVTVAQFILICIFSKLLGADPAGRGIRQLWMEPLKVNPLTSLRLVVETTNWLQKISWLSFVLLQTSSTNSEIKHVKHYLKKWSKISGVVGIWG